MAVAVQFDVRAREALAAIGVRPTQDAIVRILGVPGSTYASLVSGRQRMSIELVVSWLRIWNATMPRLAVYLNHTGVLVLRESDLGSALSYEGDDVLGEMGGRFLFSAPAGVPVDLLQQVDGRWVTVGQTCLTPGTVEGWAYFIPDTPAPGGRTAIRVALRGGRDVTVAFIDGPSLMRTLRAQSVRLPDVRVGTSDPGSRQ